MCEYLQFFNNVDLDMTIKFFTILVAAIGLGKALHEYVKAQNWKKAEFLAKEIKEFFADENVQRALLMLDWNVVDITLFEGEIENKRVFEFRDIMLEKALKHHDESLFSDEEAIIRQVFDDFLFKLGMFQNYIDSDLISTDDIKPYLKYWIKLICDTKQRRKDPKIFIQLWKFINYYDYDPVIKLFKNFDYDIIQDKKFTLNKSEITDV